MGKGEKDKEWEEKCQGRSKRKKSVCYILHANPSSIPNPNQHGKSKRGSVGRKQMHPSLLIEVRWIEGNTVASFFLTTPKPQKWLLTHRSWSPKRKAPQFNPTQEEVVSNNAHAHT